MEKYVVFIHFDNLTNKKICTVTVFVFVFFLPMFHNAISCKTTKGAPAVSVV